MNIRLIHFISKPARSLWLARRSCSSLPDQVKDIAQVFPEIINRDEEAQILKYLQPILATRRYEGDHWDSVIYRYKEIELSKNYRFPAEISEIFDRIRDTIRQQCQLPTASPFLQPHVIDLADDGSIGAHIDSVKFSGDFISGLSLLSERKMLLTKDDEASKHREITEEFPKEISLNLPPRSLYIIRGVWRYEYAHAILPASQREKTADESSNRRISIIFRNPLET